MIFTFLLRRLGVQEQHARLYRNVDRFLIIRFPTFYNFRFAEVFLVLIPEIIVSYAVIAAAHAITTSIEVLKPLSDAVIVAVIIYIANIGESFSRNLETHGVSSPGSGPDFNSPTIQKGAPLLWFVFVSLIIATPIIIETLVKLKFQYLDSPRVDYVIWIYFYIALFTSLHMKNAAMRDANANLLGDAFIAFLFNQTIILFIVFMAGYLFDHWSMLLNIGIIALISACLAYLWYTWFSQIRKPVTENKSTLRTRNAWFRALYALPMTGAILAVIALLAVGISIDECVALKVDGGRHWQSAALECTVQDKFWRWIPLGSMLFTLMVAPFILRQGRKISSLPIRL